MSGDFDIFKKEISNNYATYGYYIVGFRIVRMV